MLPDAPEPQAVCNPATRSAIFIVAVLTPGPDSAAAVRDWCGEVGAVTRSVSKRAPDDKVSCVCGLGATAWDVICGAPRPAGLHPFREIGSGNRVAPATTGDILLHIRAEDLGLCFELARELLLKLGDAAKVVDEVHGFRYFDRRAIIGFVDGTENPLGRALANSTTIGDEDPPFTGGSYVVVQKYLHDMTGWNALSVNVQERIIGRTKLSNVELEDGAKPSWSHSSLTTIVDGDREVKILRDNMPFGRPGAGEFGTYFIGYACSPDPIERMLENMFIGRPAGNYDRLLDYSRAVTGGLFFVPPEGMLESLPTATAASTSAG